MNVATFKKKFRMLRYFNSDLKTPFVNLMVNVFVHVLVLRFKNIFLTKKPVVLLFINDLKFLVAGCCKTWSEKKIGLLLLHLAFFESLFGFV